MMNPKLTVLVENTARKSGLLAEHGLSFLIETETATVLLDTGQGTVLKPNAKKLGIDLHPIEAVVLSHGHYDHTGGVATALKSIQNHPKLYAHPSAFLPKFSHSREGAARAIGISVANLQAIADFAKWVAVEQVTEIVPGLFATGPVPRTTDFEDTGGPFFKDKEGTTPDDLPDDQALFMETPNGTVVILGCAHSGVINMLRYIQTLTDQRPIHTVIGGMHLINASATRIEKTVAELTQFKLQRLYPCHCTGLKATVQLRNAFPGKCHDCPVGTIIPLGE